MISASSAVEDRLDAGAQGGLLGGDEMAQYVDGAPAAVLAEGLRQLGRERAQHGLQGAGGGFQDRDRVIGGGAFCGRHGTLLPALS